MSWMAYFQANEELRYDVTPKPVAHRHQAEYAIERLVARMANPEIGPWWTWVEEIKD